HRRRHQRQRRRRRPAIRPHELRLPRRALEATRAARRARQRQRGAERPSAPRTMTAIHTTLRRDRLIRRHIRKARRHIHHTPEPPTLQNQRTRTRGVRGLNPKRAAERQYRGRREKEPSYCPPHDSLPPDQTHCSFTFQYGKSNTEARNVTANRRIGVIASLESARERQLLCAPCVRLCSF